MTPHDPSSASESVVDEIFASFLEAIDRGERPDPEAFLALHGDHEAELRELLRGMGLLQRFVPKANNDLTQPQKRRGDSTPTLPRSTGPGLGPSRVPKVVGRYEILAEVARGGMGVVFRARDPQLNRVVALKMVLSGQLASATDLVRFRSEAEAVAQLDHPNIVPIFEVGEMEGQPYFTMKYIEGTSLTERISEISSRMAVQLLILVARAVHYAHQRGILHRDLKPGNILLGKSDEAPSAAVVVGNSAPLVPYVTDFGLAKRLNNDSQVTHTGEIVGTPSYMAPEQAAGSKILTTAVDIYSLGAILYHMVTGRKPFQADTPMQTLLDVQLREPSKLRSIRPEIDLDLEVICLKCLEKQPDHRYGSAEALAEDLERYLNGEPIRARPVSAWGQVYRWIRRRPAIAALTASLLTVTLCGVILITWKWRDADKHRIRAENAFEEVDRRAASEAQAKRDALTALGLAEASLYAQRIQRVQGEWKSNQIAKAYDQLELCKADARDWEWHHLKRMCDGTVTIRGLEDPGTLINVDDSSFSVRDKAFRWPSGEPIAAGPKQPSDVTAEDMTTILWKDGAKWKTLPGSLRTVNRSANRLATILPDKEVMVWNLKTGDKLLAVPITTWRQMLSPDGLWLLTWNDKKASIWSVDVKGEPIEITMDGLDTYRVAISPDSKFLILVKSDRLLLFDAKTGKEHAAFHQAGHAIRDYSFSKDGNRLVTSGMDRQAMVWDVVEKKLVHVLRGHESVVFPVRFSPDGKTITTGCVDGAIRVWNSDTGALLWLLRGHSRPITALEYTPDSRYVISGSEDGLVKIWNLQAPLPNVEWREKFPVCAGAALDGRDEVLALSIPEEGLVFRSIDTGKLLKTLARESIALAWHPAEPYFAFSLDQGNVLVVRWPDLAEKATLKSSNHAMSLAFSPDGSRVAIGCIDGCIDVYDWRNLKLIYTSKGAHGQIYRLAFDPQSKRLLAACQDKVVRLWDVESGRLLGEFHGHEGPVRSVAFHPTANRFVSGGEDRKILIWDIDSRQIERTLTGHAGWVSCLCYHPDGRRLVSSGGAILTSGEVRLWDVDHGQELLDFGGHDGLVEFVRFTRDGKRLLSAGMDSRCHVWDSRPMREIEVDAPR